MVQEAENMREADQRKKDTVQAKNDAETLGYQVEKQLSELKDKMTSDDAAELKKLLEDLRTCLASEDPNLEEVQQKTKDLQEKSWKVTQQAYQQGSSEDQSQSEDAKKDDKKEEAETEKEKK